MTKEEKPMPSYLFVESRDPFEARDVEEGYRLITELAAQHVPVTLFLVQNGVLAARQGARGAVHGSGGKPGCDGAGGYLCPARARYSSRCARAWGAGF